ELRGQLPQLPATWRFVLSRGLAENPEERYASAVDWELAALDALDAATDTVRVGFRTAIPGTTCPYKGLASFQAEDAPFFFGREAMVDDLVRRLQLSSTLVIGGPSGSGKSSLLRAGLIPALSAGALPGSQHWQILLFSPGPDALEELASQLGRLDPNRSAPSTESLRADPRSARRFIPPGAHVLLAIDQFEELLTGVDSVSKAERETFLDVLAAFHADRESTVRVVLAIRADFYAASAADPWLAERISTNQVLVGPMQQPELRRAIEGPAQRAGLRLETGLVAAILDDAGTEPGSLPLVAHALMETWLRRRDGLLTVEGFRAAGGVSGAISRSAEQSFHQLDEDQRPACRQLLLRLVTPGDGTPDVRRHLQWREVGDDSATRTVIDAFADDRLLTLDDRGVQIIHETLISTWPRLREWIDESRDDLRMRQKVAAAASEWQSNDRHPDLLYRGSPLTAALEWFVRGGDEPGSLSAEFLEAGRKALETEVNAAHADERRRRRVRRVAFTALTTLLLAAGVASVIALLALRTSRKNETLAQARFARALATQADSLASTQPKLALLLAAESAARSDPVSREARDALVDARVTLAQSDITPSESPIPVGDVQSVALTSDGATLFAGARDGTITSWDIATGRRTGAYSGSAEGIEHVALDPSDRWLIAVGAGGVRRWDLHARPSTKGEVVAEAGDPVWSVAFSGTGSTFATSTENGKVQIYDTATATPLGPPFTYPIDFLSVALSRDGSKVLAGTGDGRVFIWDVASRELSGAPISAHGTNDVWELAMNPDGVRFATRGSDGMAKVWSLASHNEVAKPFADAAGRSTVRKVQGLIWSHDGDVLLAGADDGRVHQWNLAAAREIGVTTAGHTDQVLASATSGAGNIMVTLGRDASVRTWDVAPRRPVATVLAAPKKPQWGLAVSPDGTQVAVGDDAGVVTVYDAGTGAAKIRLHGPRSRVFALDFVDDKRLIAGNDRGDLRVWDISTGTELRTQAGAHAGGVTSVAVSPDRELVASSGADGVVRMWRGADLAASASATRQPGAVNDVAFTPAGDVVAADNDGTVRFWRPDGSPRRERLVADPSGDAIRSVAVSPDGKTLAAATASVVTLFDLATDDALSALNGQSADPLDVAFSSDGQWFVSVSGEGHVNLWDTASRLGLGPQFAYHSGAIWHTAIIGASTVITAGKDGTVRTLDVLDFRDACTLGAGALDPGARASYLGGTKAISCPS
ncbi:MAG: hypothetical protein QOI08_2270, partial [Actinomycetota bacterium]|nr:hypothetical protein [Actinomycetota bacterium]